MICDNENGALVLIDVAISGDRNAIKKEAEKFLKYKDLIIGTTGTISKSFRQYLSNILGHTKMGGGATFCTAHILWQVLF
jgi:hypothetical protein